MTDQTDTAPEASPLDRQPHGRGGGITVHEAAELLAIDADEIEQWLQTGVLIAWRDTHGRDLLSANAVDALAARRTGEQQS